MAESLQNNFRVSPRSTWISASIRQENKHRWAQGLELPQSWLQTLRRLLKKIFVTSRWKKVGRVREEGLRCAGMTLRFPASVGDSGAWSEEDRWKKMQLVGDEPLTLQWRR